MMGMLRYLCAEIDWLFDEFQGLEWCGCDEPNQTGFGGRRERMQAIIAGGEA